MGTVPKPTNYKSKVLLSDWKVGNGHACCCDIIITEVTMFDVIAWLHEMGGAIASEKQVYVCVFEWLRKLPYMYKCVWGRMLSDVLCVYRCMIYDACVIIDKWDVFHALAPCCSIVFLCVCAFCAVIVIANLHTVLLFCLYSFEWTDGCRNRCLSTASWDGGGWNTFEKTNREVCDRGKKLVHIKEFWRFQLLQTQSRDQFTMDQFFNA